MIGETSIFWWDYALRAPAILLGCAAIVTYGVLFWRIWRFFVPPAAARLVLLSAIGISTFAMLEVLDHVNKEPTWRAPVILLTYILHETGLLVYLLWTYRPDGRKRRHAMRAEYEAHRLLVKEGHKP